VDTVDEADEPDQPGDCPGTTQAAAMDPGAHMKSKLATPVATAAAAMLLLSACSDGDGPRLLARGDVQFVGSDGLAGQKLDIDVSEDDGEVTGEARFNQVVLGLGCTDVRDGALLLGGEVTTPSGDGTPAVGERIAVVIRDGDPDRVALWPGQDLDGTCEELLAEITDEVLADESIYADVEGDGDIETSLDD
jgi:hypothetical protein